MRKEDVRHQLTVVEFFVSNLQAAMTKKTRQFMTYQYIRKRACLVKEGGTRKFSH